MIKNISRRARCTFFLLVDTRGAAAVLLSLMLATLLGFVALGVETGLWFSEKRQYQSAADAAAMSGAFLLASADPNAATVGTPCNATGNCLAAIKAFATAMATQNGYVAGAGNSVTIIQGCWTTSFAASTCSSGTFSRAFNAVKVLVSEQKSTMLAAAYRPNVTIAASAIAQVIDNFGGGACVLSLDPNADDAKDVDFQGNPTVTLTGCVVASNSPNADSINIQGSASLTAEDIYTVGGYSAGKAPSLDTALVPVTGGQPVPDPFADDFPNNPSMPSGVNCSGKLSSISGGGSVSAGTYSDVNISGNGTTTFSGGTYYVCGDFKVTGTAALSGTGVTFVVDGNISMNGTGTVTLSAPTTSTAGTPDPGILFYQPGSASSKKPPTAVISGNNSSTFTGAIYSPGGSVQFTGSSVPGSAGCTEIVGYTVTLQGNTNINMTNTGCQGDGVPLVTITNVALAQ
jgi:Flp pilus assembly protein TadG